MRIILTLGLVVFVTACSTEAPRSPVASRDAAAPGVSAQTLGSPCDLLPRDAVERLLGRLNAAPRLGRSAESPRPDDRGAACVYPVTAEDGSIREVAIGIALDGAMGFEQGMGMLGQQISKEQGGSGELTGTREARVGWDHRDALPTLTVWRIGHLAVEIGGQTFRMPRGQLDSLATLVRDGVPDRPFAAPGADPNGSTSGSGPCALLTRDEAEQVLGTLAVPPYRSQEATPLADRDGPSCSYYTRGHRVLVLTPTPSDGKVLFGMASGVSGLVSTTLRLGGESADTLDGPWDQAAAGTTGSLYFLKGDKLLEVSYRMSATDAAGATRLARAAVERM